MTKRKKLARYASILLFLAIPSVCNIAGTIDRSQSWADAQATSRAWAAEYQGE